VNPVSGTRMAQADPAPSAGWTPSPGVLTEVDAVFRSLVDDLAAPGVSYAVVGRAGLLHAAGHGAVCDGGPRPDAATAFRIASMTKSFTAAAVLLLVREGALSLADPVGRWVWEFRDVRLPTADSPDVTGACCCPCRAGCPPTTRGRTGRSR
jgi:D-alanyl-D-alanine carboxypeptidase